MNSHFNPLEFPKLERYVNDYSGVLTSGERDTLNELFAKHEKDTSEQVVVVLFPHRQGHELLEIGLKLFNENGIGQKGQNNGLLLIIATDEKKIRLITGKGMEIKYSEMRCHDIIEGKLRLLLNNSEFSELINTFKEIISSSFAFSEEFDSQETKKTQNKPLHLILILAFIWCLQIGIVGKGLFMGDLVILGTQTIYFIIGLLFLRMSMKNFRILRLIGFHVYLFSFILLINWNINWINLAGKCEPVSSWKIFGRPMYKCEREYHGFSSKYYSPSINGDFSSSYLNSGKSDFGGGGGSSFGGGGGSSNGGGYGD